MSDGVEDRPIWRRSPPQNVDLAHQVEHERRQHLLLDPRYPLDIDQDVLDPMYRPGRRFWILTTILGGLVIMWGVTWFYQMAWGMGVTGLNRPVMWALYIVNFVYFIGIGHAGTFISAALRVLKVEWRRPISRIAETLTIFALLTAAMFPLVHLGRTWKFYWLLPIPNQRQIWPSFHSPLLWDMTAIFTYLSCSVLFAYIGLLPDFAMARDHTGGWRHTFYRFLALGWVGTEREWTNQATAMNVFSYAIIPVMFSVHTIVSWDFAMAIQPGWHSTVFGPYFVVGALFSGVAAVILVMALARKGMHLEYFLRAEHFDGMGKFLLLLSLAWAYFYFNDYIVPWYGQGPVEKIIQQMLALGSTAPLWYLMIFSNIVLPWAMLWSKKVRTSIPAIMIISIFVQVGMYLERYIIIPVTLGRNELPYDWGIYIPHWPESLITIGAFAFVGFLYLIFSRLLPLIPVWEVYEGQVMKGLRRIGKALIPTRSEPD
jgi:molybdopterin-containing oxidoreductase family membrane subunit